jgi:DNA-binding protein HU-beta
LALNKSELAAAIAERTDLNVKQAQDVIDALTATISDELASGNSVSIAGFGKFSVNQRAARQGRNPNTGETLKIAAGRSPKFSSAQALKMRMAGLPGEPND